MAGKPIRLGKAAGELNVGLPTIVEFLVTKGIKIDSNPNTRLEPEHFDLLLKEFAADQSMMEKAKGTSNRRERRETVTMSDIAPEEKKVIKDSKERKKHWMCRFSTSSLSLLIALRSLDLFLTAAEKNLTYRSFNCKLVHLTVQI